MSRDEPVPDFDFWAVRKRNRIQARTSGTGPDSESGRPPVSARQVFFDPVVQRMVVLDPGGRWTGALRNNLLPQDRRAVIPALNWEGAAAIAHSMEQTLILSCLEWGEIPARPAGKQIAALVRKIAEQNFPGNTLLVSVIDARMREWRLVLLEAGFCRVFTSLTQLDSVIGLARRFFSGQIRTDTDFRKRLAMSMPWPAHANSDSFDKNNPETDSSQD